MVTKTCEVLCSEKSWVFLFLFFVFLFFNQILAQIIMRAIEFETDSIGQQDGDRESQRDDPSNNSVPEDGLVING